MATIRSQFVITDGMTPILKNICNAMTATITSFENMQRASGRSVDTAQLRKAREQIAQVGANIRQAEQEQERFNRQLQEGSNQTNGLSGKIKGLVGAYVGLQGLKKVVGLSDELTQTKARLNLLTGDLEMTDAMMNQIYQSSQRSRVGFLENADVVAKLGLRAKDAFTDTNELIKFSETLNKMFVIAGASQAEISSASLQLTQALGSGVLRGEEFNAVFESAPNVMQAVADSMGVPIGQLRNLAAEGEITADIVKNALIEASGDIDKQFESMPMTWGQVWQGIVNTVIYYTQPLLNLINLIANNWDSIGPVVYALTAVIGGYVIAMGLANTVTAIQNTLAGISTARSVLKTGKTLAEAAATKTATGAQVGLNAAMLACPLTWIILLIAVVIGLIIGIIKHMQKTGQTTSTVLGYICGWINVVIQFFVNLGKCVANIAMGIWGAMKACGSNIKTFFSNVIKSVQSGFYSLLSTAMTVVSGIASLVNKIPGVDIDVNGIQAKADYYQYKSAAAESNKGTYQDIGAAFSQSKGSYDAFSDGWTTSAMNKGKAFGNNLTDKIFSSGDAGLAGTAAELGGGTAADIAKTAGNTGKTADSADSIAGAVDKSANELKYLREIAERKAVNQFTTAEIKVDMSNMNNNITGYEDIDGFVGEFSEKLKETLEVCREGV